jgi:uncharacterized phage infection (PIP) family protein YhgE
VISDGSTTLIAAEAVSPPVLPFTYTAKSLNAIEPKYIMPSLLFGITAVLPI